MKLKIGFGVAEDIAYVRSVRDAIGPGPELMVDANHAYNVGAALRILKAIEPAQIHWFEEPISPEEVWVSRSIEKYWNGTDAVERRSAGFQGWRFVFDKVQIGTKQKRPETRNTS